MTDPILYPRFVRSRLEEALEDTPVVLVHGPRQCGKTTLALMVGDAAGYEYITFDDDVQLAAAQADPVGFVADLTDRTVLDEVQRVPALFLSLKTAVDRDRRPGRFILTGSANVLLVPNYVVLLERIFLPEHLQPWHSNRLRRLIKTPKLHLGDTGLASALLGVDSEFLVKDRAMLGQLPETFVFQELKRQASWSDTPVQFYHFRDKDGVEVDIVLEKAGTVAGIEIKAAATVMKKDFRGLKKLREATGERFAAGVVVYDGEHVAGFGEKLWAVPIRALWETLAY